MKALLEDLSTIADPRRQAGKRHDLEVVLFLCILAVLQGADGYRSIGRFVKDNREFLHAYLTLKKERLPSTSTVSRVLQVVDPLALSQVLAGWQTKRMPVQDTYFLCGDGKAMRGTIEDSRGKSQNYVSVCSFFEAFSNMVVSAVAYENGKKSEIEIFQKMITSLDLPGNVIISGDALHCQKKQ